MRNMFLLFLAFGPVVMLAQNFPIGSRSLSFFDSSRNRNIPAVIHYPGASAGSNAPVAVGDHPVLVMGHGFVMVVEAYNNLRDHFVPRGYVLVLPTTAGGFNSEHADFGQDLSFLAQAMQDEGADEQSPFFGHVAPASALMGHSMGGGASFLGAANNTSIQTLVNFAPAETDPSAVAAAASVLVPTLVFAGSNDCVTPIIAHQGPMYAALNTPCRAFVNITGGGHCYFANSNFNCSLGELTCSPSPAITRAQQHSVVNDLASLWLDHFLKAVPEAFEAFQDSLLVSSRALSEFTCLSTGLADTPDADVLHLMPVPASDRMRVQGAAPGSNYRILDALGRTVGRHGVMPMDAMIDLRDLSVGTYRLVLEKEGTQVVRTFLVAR